jgi:hypothetical protein
VTIIFHDAVDQDGVFDILGAAFSVQAAVNTARGTTIPTEVTALLDLLRALPVDATRDAIAASIPTALTGYQSSGSGIVSALQRFCREYLIDVVRRDVPSVSATLKPALEELIAQMLAEGESVDASTVTAAATPDAGNVGDGVMVLSIRRGDGLVQENLLGETLIATATQDGQQARFSVAGGAKVDLLSQNWPGGSGASASLTSAGIATAGNLLTNGGMDDEDDLANAPDDWTVAIGTVGTTIKMTDVEVQTVAIGGTPTGGNYTLHWENADALTQSTPPLAFDATAAAVQAALRTIVGLELVTVTAAGTSPNLTHTVTFIGRGGNVNQMTSTSRLTGGTPTITHGTTTAGTPQVYGNGKALIFDSDGSQLTTILQQLTGLTALTAYAVSLWGMVDVVPAAGVITIDLVDGDGGAVIQDAQGANNSVSFDAADLDDAAWQHLTELVAGECVFRLPAVLPNNVFLRIRISTAVSNTTSVFLDHVALARMTSLYAGGPLGAIFTGSKGYLAGDRFSIATTNNRAGLVQEFFRRNFDMAALGLLLPSNSGGTETVPDSVV